MARRPFHPHNLVSPVRKTNSVNYRNEADLIAGCPLAAAMRLVGGRWKLMIVWYVHHGLNRFGRLKSTIPHISEKMLYQQLRELEQVGMLLRVMEGRSVRYEPTELARSLVPLLTEMEAWSREHRIAERLLKAANRPLREAGTVVGQDKQ